MDVLNELFEKFTFITESGETLGTCSEISGWAEVREYEPEDEGVQVSTITLIDFVLNPSFAKYRNRTRVQLEALTIEVRNRAGQVLSELYVSPVGKIDWKQQEFELGVRNLELKMAFSYLVSNSVRQVWSLWEDSLPTRKNEWMSLSAGLQKGWLDAVRYLANRHTTGIGHSAKPFELDLQGVKNETALFLALGEAVVGPAGYYGWDLLSLDDLLCCEPGLPTPFTLYTMNGQHEDMIDWRNIFPSEEQESARRLNDLFSKYGIRFVPLRQSKEV